MSWPELYGIRQKVRMLETDEYHSVGEKDALVALKALLDKKIKYTMDEAEIRDLEDLDDFELATPAIDPSLDPNEKD